VDTARAGLLTDSQPAQELRSAGLRATRPRLAVLGFLRQNWGCHLSAEQVTAGLAEAGEALLRGSVYNVLGSLVAAGLVIVADAGPGRALYEASGTWHHHFVCRSCREVSDVPCVTGTMPCLEAELAGAVVDQAQVIFRGLCPACAADGGALTFREHEVAVGPSPGGS